MKQVGLQNERRFFAPRSLAVKFLVLSFALIISEVASDASSVHARVVATQMDINNGLKTALDHFKIDCGRYPTTVEGINALVNCPTNISTGRWHGPYLDIVPCDPWGNPYIYRYPGIHNTNGYDLYSCGEDGISKSEGDDLDDINNWNPSSPRGRNFSADLSDLTVFPLVFLIVPFLGLVHLISAIFSQRVRNFIKRHPIAHSVWFVLSLIAIFLLLCIPRIAG